MPKVTVLMPVYNGEKFLQEAIESILGQTWTDFEFIIINDSSTDSSRDMILSFDDHRVRLVDNHTRLGLTKSLNRGLRLSKGELIARQDADDISYPTRLDQEVRFLESNPEVALLGTRARAVDENGTPKGVELRIPTGLVAIRWFLMFQNAFIHSSVMFRRNIIWKRLGGYDESYLRAQDYDMWSRTARNYIVENLPDILLDHRYEYGSIVSQLPLCDSTEEDIVYKNLQAFLQNHEVPNDWANFIARFKRRDNFDRHTNWKHIAEMFKKICASYSQLHPEARFEQAIRLHMASSLYWISYYSAPHHRNVSFRSYVKARELGSKSNGHPSLAKYITLWVAGEGVRSASQRFIAS
jgi:glycosyltransferase involved in cell wall biosynthesis